MTLMDLLRHYAGYNAWANARIAGMVLDAGESVADSELSSSFHTIRKTLQHITGAQEIWMQRLQNGSPASWPAPQNEPLEETLRRLNASSEKFKALVAGFRNADPERPVHYNNLKGEAFSNTAGHIVLHCMNHGTHHRGQVVNMLRQSGYVKLVSTDYIAFCREE